MSFRAGAQVRRIRLGIVVTSCAVVACAPAPAPDRARHDVDYYRQHTYERNRQVYVCANDPGSLGKQPDCVNAREAARIEGVGSLKALPPMDFPVPPAPQPK